MSEAIRYGGWSKEAQGYLWGLTGTAWGVMVGAAMPILFAFGAGAWLFALAWMPVALIVVLGVAVPIRGRPAFVWTRDALVRLIGGAMGWTAWQSRAATGRPKDLKQLDLPGVLSGIRTHDGPPLGGMRTRPAIVQDVAARTWAVVARIEHPGIGLAEASARARMASGLADLLEGVVTAQLISTLAIQVRTIPDDGAEREAWQRRHIRPTAPALALQVNAELGPDVTSGGVRHEVFVTVVVEDRKIARQARSSGGGMIGRARLLYSVMSEIETRLSGAVGCSSVEWLDSPQLAMAIRTGFAPGDRAGLIEEELDDHRGRRRVGVPAAAAGPSHAPHPERRHYIHDAWSSVACTVLMPERGAVMGALAPVLIPTTPGERRCMTVFFEPLPHQMADRMVGREQMSASAAAQMRSKFGFGTRAAHERDAAKLVGKDARLASGRALVRSAIAVAVTVPSTWPVEDYGRRLESSIRSSGYPPLRLDLAQDSGFAAACIPLGVGLPRRRGVG